jgi:hypothetical protein
LIDDDTGEADDIVLVGVKGVEMCGISVLNQGDLLSIIINRF